MSNNEKGTEELIYEAACKVFQEKGYAGARMQEIADEADINISMLHYYYRNKDKLFEEVYQGEFKRFYPVIFGVLDSDMPLDEKVEDLIKAYYEFLDNNPKIAQFIIQEMNQNPQRLRNFVGEINLHQSEKFKKQIQEEIKKGNMDDVAPEQLLSSIVGLILFPFLSPVMLKEAFSMDEEGFKEYLSERKDFLLNFILNGINYKRQ